MPDSEHPKLDASLHSPSLQAVPGLIKALEALGFDAVWTSETRHDPFMPLAIAALHSTSIGLGTAIAVAFARSPGTLAYSAWDLAKASNGRFILGLGTQVRAHIERRFGMAWPESPAGKLREMISAIRSLWNAWQTGGRLDHRGAHYKLTLMSPFFDPGPIDHPHIPIYIAGVNPGLCRLTGEIGDGFLAHPLHSPSYLRDVVRPAINAGAKAAGRDPDGIQLSATVFVAAIPEDEAFIRAQIAFYASTPSYRRVMEYHGWADTAEELSGLARRQEWDAMAGLISTEMLDTIAVVGTQEEIPDKLLKRYSGLADRLTIYKPYHPGDDGFWSTMVAGIKRG
jgi:probable F420-dependent oxidoreductase